MRAHPQSVCANACKPLQNNLPSSNICAASSGTHIETFNTSLTTDGTHVRMLRCRLSRRLFPGPLPARQLQRTGEAAADIATRERRGNQLDGGRQSQRVARSEPCVGKHVAVDIATSSGNEGSPVITRDQRIACSTCTVGFRRCPLNVMSQLFSCVKPLTLSLAILF